MTDVIITSVVDPQANVAEPLSDGAEADPQSANDSSQAQDATTKDATPKDATTEGRTATPKLLNIYRS